MRLRSRSLPESPIEKGKNSATGDPEKKNAISYVISNSCENISENISAVFDMSPPVVNPVLIAPAAFSRSDPTSWFRQLEAIFDINKVTDDNLRYVYVQARVDPAILSEVNDFFMEPPESDKYKKLKARLISQFSTSTEKNVQQLLQGQELGDRRPTQLLREMKNLAGGKVTDDILRTLFLQRLPAQLQFVLAGSKDTLELLAETADKMCDCPALLSQSRGHEIHAVSRDPTQSHLMLISEQLTKLVSAVADLASRLDKLNTGATSNRPRDASRSRERNRNDAPTGVSLCYYHYTYGTNARSCKKVAADGTPCLMKKEN